MPDYKENIQANPLLVKAAFRSILGLKNKAIVLEYNVNRKDSITKDLDCVSSKKNEFVGNMVMLQHKENLFLFVEKSYFDAHCHLDFLLKRAAFCGPFSDFKKQHQQEFPSSFAGCIAVFCNPYSFGKFFSWKKHLDDNMVWASFGCHPKNAASYDDSIERDLLKALEHPKVRALGEIGLDYSDRSFCPRNKQIDVFRRQLRIAKGKRLPLVLHCREAYEDCFAILKEELADNYPIHLHCFSDAWCIAEKFLKEFSNLYIGLTNLVTFPSATEVHEVAKNVPLNKLLLETDAPYFVPNSLSKSTKFAHPGMAIYVAAKVASLKNVPLNEVAFHTRQNANWIYNV